MDIMTESRKLIVALVVLALPGITAISLVLWLRHSHDIVAPTTAAADPLQVLFGDAYADKVRKITTLLEVAPTSRPSISDSAELLNQAEHDPDFRIRVRAMAVLPFIEDRDKAIDVLIRCTHDRESESSGNGNVPLYATNYLADMSATRAIPDVEDWVKYLQRKPPSIDETTRAMILNKSSGDLAHLKHSAATRPAKSL